MADQQFGTVDGAAREPLAGRRVLVTGGAGFIGGHLCEELARRGAEILALDDLSTGDARNIADLLSTKKVRFLRGSVRREEDVAKAFAFQPDVVFHLAAAVGVRLIIERPVESIETNIRGTELILEHAARTNAKVLVASSSEVYGKGAKTPFSEDDDLLLGPTIRPRWSYACSKMIDEFLALAYHRSQGLPAVVMRFFNTVGPRQTGRYGMVIPRLTAQALSGAPLTVYGDGRQSRCFCHVRDTAGMVADLAELPEASGRIFNVGNDQEISILDLAKKIVERSGCSSEIRLVPFEEAYDENFEDLQRRVPDLRKIQTLLGRKPSLGIDQIVDETRQDLERRARRAR